MYGDNVSGSLSEAYPGFAVWAIPNLGHDGLHHPAGRPAGGEAGVECGVGNTTDARLLAGPPDGDAFVGDRDIRTCWTGARETRDWLLSELDEFSLAKREVIADPMTAHVWQPIIAKYNPTLILECQHAITWSRSMVLDWLKTGMLKDDPTSAESVINYLASHVETATHNRHISAAVAREKGLKVELLEDDQQLQELVLSVHHAFMQTLADPDTLKLVANHRGVARYATPII